MDVAQLPALNAGLNMMAGIFLICGWFAIKSRRVILHQKFMAAAMVSSTLFLCSYVTYHYLKQGMVTQYQGTAAMRVIYFFILGTHTPLAALIVPFSIAAVFFAVRKKYTAHVRITQWLLPVWIYVSVTGVLIYVMLYIW